MMIVYQGNSYQVRVGDLLQVAGVPITRLVTAGTGLSGGGELSHNITLDIAPGGVGTVQLSTTGVTSGTYGDASNIPVFIVDSKGRVTNATQVPVTVTGYVPITRTVIAGSGLTGGGALNTDVTLAANLTSSTPLSGYVSGVVGSSSEIARSNHRHPAVDMSNEDEVDGVLSMSHGGAGVGLSPDSGAIVWSGPAGLYVGPVGAAGTVLTSGGASEYTWSSVDVDTPRPANTLRAGPATGVNAIPTFRAMVNADLPASGVVANTYGSGSQIPVVTVNAKGVVTNVTTSAVAPALTGDVTTVGTASSIIEWSAGNITYVPLAGDIQTYVTAATAGDTLILASGTYVVTSTITVDKALTIKGQGSAATKINSSTAAIAVFTIAASNVRLLDISSTNSGAGTAYAIFVNAGFTNLQIRNFIGILSGTGTKYGVWSLSSVTVSDSEFYPTSSDSNSNGVYLYNDSSTTLNITANIQSVRVIATGVANNNRGIVGNNNNTAYTITINSVNNWLFSYGTTGTTDIALYTYSTTTNNVTINDYQSILNGADHDVLNTATNVITLNGSILINGNINGTVTRKYDMQASSSTVDGYLTSTDWSTFNGKVSGPATNTSDYLPQWNGTDSRTLKNGLAVPAGGLAGLTALGTKQDTLVNGSNIKSINANTLLGAGNLTLAIINWLGVYNAVTLYLPNDAVSYAGSSYICTAPTGGGKVPTDISYWGLLAVMGDPGVSGISGGFNLPITNASGTSIVVNHKFNAYPIVQIYDESGAVVIPVSITFTDADNVTVVLSSAIPSGTGHIICSIGGVSTAVTSKAADYTLLPTDNLVLVTAACTITLPVPTGLQGKIYNIKDMAENGIPIIVSGGGNTIDDELTKTLIAKYTTITVFTNGSNWFII